MENLEALIESAKAGDDRAFAEIIGRFQDMAFGYAYTLLNDLQLAEDAVQEAFVEAYYNLIRLKDPAAFPGWLRRIVQFRCSRVLDRKKLTQVPLDLAAESASRDPGPYEVMERQDIGQKVYGAINGLSQHLREATTLFFINGYTKSEIAGFLEIPENTVKSRLKASREQLQRSLNMSDVIKETLNKNKLPEDFARKVIEGIPKVGFYINNSTKNDNIPDGAQMTTFPSCLSRCLEKMGVKTKYKIVDVYSHNYRFNELYTYLMGTSGAAFRLIWNPGKWDGSNIDIIVSCADPLDPFNRAFDAIGYEFEIIGNKDHGHDADKSRKFFIQYEDFNYFKKRITASIDNNLPVMALGVVGPPECCLVTGYDKAGNVLIGWSFFQEMPDLASGVEFEPSGYFKQREWFKNTPGIILIGKKKSKPKLSNIYYNALKHAVTLSRTENVYDRKGGLAAFKAWADDLLVDEDFSLDDTDKLWQCMMAHNDANNCIAEGRWYAKLFLKQIIESGEISTDQKNQLNKAADCYDAVHHLMIQNWGICGPALSEELIRLLADPKIRRKIAPIVLQMRDKEEEAISIIEKVIEKW